MNRNYFAKLLLILSLTLAIPSTYANSFLSPLTDSVNSGILNSKIAMDSSVSLRTIDATVENGIAIISGEVDNREQLQKLEQIARSISGVKGVDVSRVKIKN